MMAPPSFTSKPPTPEPTIYMYKSTKHLLEITTEDGKKTLWQCIEIPSNSQSSHAHDTSLVLDSTAFAGTNGKLYVHADVVANKWTNSKNRVSGPAEIQCFPNFVWKPPKFYLPKSTTAFTVTSPSEAAYKAPLTRIYYIKDGNPGRANNWSIGEGQMCVVREGVYLAQNREGPLLYIGTVIPGPLTMVSPLSKKIAAPISLPN